MVEAAVLALAGGVLGILVGASGFEALKALAGRHVRRVGARDTRLRACSPSTMGLSLVTSVVFGLVPALAGEPAQRAGGARRRRLAQCRRQRAHWPRRLLVVAEVALGVVLLVTAGLLLRTFVNLCAARSRIRSAQPRHGERLAAGRALRDGEADQPAVRRQAAAAAGDARRRSAGVSLELPYDRLLNSCLPLRRRRPVVAGAA